MDGSALANYTTGQTGPSTHAPNANRTHSTSNSYVFSKVLNADRVRLSCAGCAWSTPAQQPLLTSERPNSLPAARVTAAAHNAPKHMPHSITPGNAMYRPSSPRLSRIGDALALSHSDYFLDLLIHFSPSRFHNQPHAAQLPGATHGGPRRTHNTWLSPAQQPLPTRNAASTLPERLNYSSSLSLHHVHHRNALIHDAQVIEVASTSE